MSISGTIQIPDKKKSKRTYTHSTSSFVCENVQFDFESEYPEAYKAAFNVAAKNIKDEYIENQEAEESDIEFGIITADEAEYSKPFDVAEHILEIQSEAQRYLRILAEIPDKIIVTFDGDFSVDNLNANDIKIALRKQCNNIPIISVGNVSAPRSSDILRYETYENAKKMMNSSDYKTFLQLKNSLKDYSYNNICMIYGQLPTAKMVKGFNSWKEKYGRQVSKGTHALKIWCPMFAYLKTEKDVDKWLKTQPVSSSAKAIKKDAMMKEIAEKGKIQVIKGYNMGNVFDISQTEAVTKEGEKLGDALNLNKPLSGEIDNACNVCGAINSTIVNGKYDADIKPCSTDKESMYKCIHQYAEDIMGHAPHLVSGIKALEVSQGRLFELETLIATGMICDHIGIDEAMNKVALSMAKTLDCNNLIDGVKTEKDVSKALSEGGRAELFRKAFTRGSALAAQFEKDFDREYEGITKLFEQNKDKFDIEHDL